MTVTVTDGSLSDTITVNISVTDVNEGGPSAAIAAVTPFGGSAGDSLTANNLNGTTLVVGLANAIYVPQADLAAADFALETTIAGLSIASVTRDSDTGATLTLAYNGADFEGAAFLVVTVRASGTTSATTTDLFTGTVAVAAAGEWIGIVPPELNPGDRYRILFVTHGKRNATSSDIDTYNAFVQEQAASASGNPFGAVTFKVLGSTEDVDVRCNTQTHRKKSDCPGVARVDNAPIYYYKGEKVADHYGDFYNGNWDSQAPRDQRGSRVTRVRALPLSVATGSNPEGEERIHVSSRALGAYHFVSAGQPLIKGKEIFGHFPYSGSDSQFRFYALSEVLTASVPAPAPTNRAPTFTENSPVTRTVAENTPPGQNVGNPVSATDPDSSGLTYTLGGTDEGSFAIVASSGQLLTAAALDYESKASYQVTVTVSDGSLTDAITVDVSVTNVDEAPGNQAPTFTETPPTARTVAENTPPGRTSGTRCRPPTRTPPG